MYQKISNTIQYINLFAGLALISTTLLDIDIQRYILYCFFISYGLEMIIEKKWNSFKTEPSHWFFIALIILFSLMFIYHPFEGSNLFWNKLLNPRYSLLGFGIIGLFGLNDKYRLRYFIVMLIISAIAYILYLLFAIGIYEFVTNPERSRIFSETRIELLNTHMFFNFYINTALICCLFLVVTQWKKMNVYSKIFVIFSICFFYSVLFISEGRSGFIAVNVLISSVFLWEVWKKNKVVFAVASAGCFVLFFIALSHHSRMERQQLYAEPRLLLWQEAVEVIKESPLLGHGVCKGEERFLQRLEENELIYSIFAIEFSKNLLIDSHNQFLQIYIEFGMIGLCLLLFIYLYPLIIVSPERRLLMFLFLFISIWQSMFDMFITGNFSFFFLFMLTLLLKTSPQFIPIRRWRSQPNKFF